jgi:DNA polymerase III subunit gamma/tau
VAGFTDRILRGATAEAIALLHEQCENGKDMMKLMSDLISYLRDLLVFKVKPEALAEDSNPELQQSLETQSASIETDRLLELIDQFAAAEGRMKWAPNKKLHFEVAVIKAIETLGQVTLNDVIENLSALRDGKSTPASVAAVADRGARLSDPGYKEGGARLSRAVPDVSSGTPAKSAESTKRSAPPDAEQDGRDTRATQEETSALDVSDIWRKLSGKIPPQKRFLKSLIESTRALGAEGRTFLIGYPPEQKSVIETLATENNRRFLQSLLKEISGRDWDVKFLVKEGLSSAPMINEQNESTPVEPKKTSAESFKDDPLIREALEIFKGEIKTVTD